MPILREQQDIFSELAIPGRTSQHEACSGDDSEPGFPVFRTLHYLRDLVGSHPPILLLIDGPLTACRQRLEFHQFVLFVFGGGLRDHLQELHLGQHSPNSFGDGSK